MIRASASPNTSMGRTPTRVYISPSVCGVVIWVSNDIFTSCQHRARYFLASGRPPYMVSAMRPIGDGSPNHWVQCAGYRGEPKLRLPRSNTSHPLRSIASSTSRFSASESPSNRMS